MHSTLTSEYDGGNEIGRTHSKLTAATGRLSYGATVDARVRAAIDASHLRGLPADVLEELMAERNRRDAFPRVR